MYYIKTTAALSLALLAASLSRAQDEVVILSAGDTAWMLTVTALVLFITIPGLSLFYVGMVRSKNVLSDTSIVTYISLKDS